MQQLAKPQPQNHNSPKQRIPWNLKIQANSKHFHLNFNFKSSFSLSSFNLNTKQSPSSSSSSSSLFLNAKLLKCHLFLSSQFGSPSIKSKIFRFFRKLIPKKSKKSTLFPQKIALKLKPRKSLWVGLVAAMLVSLIRFPLGKIVSSNNGDGVAKFLDNLCNFAVDSMYDSK